MLKFRKRKATPRYEIRSSIRAFHTYTDREWAEHIAKCYASFFGTSVEVVDAETGTTLCTKFPPNRKEVQA